MIHTNQSDLRDMVRNLQKQKGKKKKRDPQSIVIQDRGQKGGARGGLKQERCHTQNRQKNRKVVVWERKRVTNQSADWDKRGVA